MVRMSSSLVLNVMLMMDILPHYTQPVSLQGFDYSFASLGRRKIHILHKIKVLPDSSPTAGQVPVVLLLVSCLGLALVQA